MAAWEEDVRVLPEQTQERLFKIRSGITFAIGKSLALGSPLLVTLLILFAVVSVCRLAITSVLANFVKLIPGIELLEAQAVLTESSDELSGEGGKRLAFT